MMEAVRIIKCCWSSRRDAPSDLGLLGAGEESGLWNGAATGLRLGSQTYKRPSTSGREQRSRRPRRHKRKTSVYLDNGTGKIRGVSGCRGTRP